MLDTSSLLYLYIVCIFSQWSLPFHEHNVFIEIPTVYKKIPHSVSYQ